MLLSIKKEPQRVLVIIWPLYYPKGPTDTIIRYSGLG